MDKVDIIWKIWVPLARLLSGNFGSGSVGLRDDRVKRFVNSTEGQIVMGTNDAA